MTERAYLQELLVGWNLYYRLCHWGCESNERSAFLWWSGKGHSGWWPYLKRRHDREPLPGTQSEEILGIKDRWTDVRKASKLRENTKISMQISYNKAAALLSGLSITRNNCWWLASHRSCDLKQSMPITCSPCYHFQEKKQMKQTSAASYRQAASRCCLSSSGHSGWDGKWCRQVPAVPDRCRTSSTGRALTMKMEIRVLENALFFFSWYF